MSGEGWIDIAFILLVVIVSIISWIIKIVKKSQITTTKTERGVKKLQAKPSESELEKFLKGFGILPDTKKPKPKPGKTYEPAKEEPIKTIPVLKEIRPKKEKRIKKKIRKEVPEKKRRFERKRERIGKVQPEIPAVKKRGGASEIRKFLGGEATFSKTGLRKAIVLAEILGPPIALRKGRKQLF